MKLKLFKYIVIPVLLIILVFQIYSHALQFGYIENWDDNVAVFDNPDIQGFSYHNLKNWFTKGYLSMFQPVTLSTYTLNFEIDNLNPGGYHLFNVILFFLIIFLIWRLLYTLTDNYWAAAIVTLFFAVHPFAVESVTWITGRITLLMVFFILIALNYYASGGRNFLILFSLYLLATLSKINGILLPAYLLAIDFSQNNKPFSKSNLIPKIWMILLLLPAFIFSLSLRSPESAVSVSGLISLVPAKYLWYLNHLIPVYEYSPVYEPPVYFDWRNLIGLLFILLTFWIYRQSSDRDRKIIITGSLIYICSLVPHMIPYSNGAHVGDRYGFVSYIGIAVILVAFINHFSSIRKYYIILIALFGIISGVNVINTYRYNMKWENSITLWSHSVAVVPESSFAHYKLGTLYFLKGDERAREELITSVTLDPEFSIAYHNLGSISFYQSRFDEAVMYYTRVYELENRDFVLIDRATSYFELKDYQKAISDLDQYIKEAPVAKAFFLRGQSKIALGLDGCEDLKLSLNMGMDQALSIYAKNCMGNY